MISGTIEFGGRQWDVREERRQGPYERVFVLEALDQSGSRMQVRPEPGVEVRTLDEVRVLAVDPYLRWFQDGKHNLWEARMVISSEPGQPDRRLVKLLGTSQVYEVPYDFTDGLGARTEEEMQLLLSLGGKA